MPGVTTKFTKLDTLDLQMFEKNLKSAKWMQGFMVLY